MFKRRTVVVQLMGGLGNQLFQLAAGLYVCRQLGYQLELNTRFFDKHQVHDGFCLNKLLDLSDITEARGGGYSLPRRIRESGVHKQLLRLVAAEKIRPSFRGLSLHGYWQTAYTVAETRKELLNRLITKPSWEASVESDVCFIHVRRGDYITPANKPLYDVIPENSTTMRFCLF